MAVNLETSKPQSSIIFLNYQHVGKPIFQLSTPKEKIWPHLI